MNTEIYYFSGTGNSLRIARELQAKIPGAKLIPIIHLLHGGPIKSSAETIGFVFPNFCLTAPIPLHDFLEIADLASAKYIFALCVRGGSESQAFDYINEILKKQGKRLNAGLNITMPWNHPIGKENLIGRDSESRKDRLEIEMQKQVASFSQFILKQEDFFPADETADFKVPPLMKWIFDVLVPRSTNYRLHEYFYQTPVRFYAGVDCNACGICEQVCLNNRIELIDGKPVWLDGIKCYACFACINFCPKKAIQVEKSFLVDSHTAENPRYHHPKVTYREIATQR
jgi:ferredoxin